MEPGVGRGDNCVSSYPDYDESIIHAIDKDASILAFGMLGSCFEKMFLSPVR